MASNSELTEKQKLVMLGLRSPNQQTSSSDTTIKELQNQIAEVWDDFESAFKNANLGSFDDFEQWLNDNGFSSDLAEQIRDAYDEKFDSFTDLKDSVENIASSWEEFLNNFRSGSGLRSDLRTNDDLAAAGIKIYEETGVSRDGVKIPAGGIEIFGREVHFSQTDSTRSPQEDQSSDPISYANLTISDTSPTPSAPIDVSADVTNNTNVPDAPASVELIVDDSVRDSKTVKIGANSTTTVTFQTDFEEFDSYDVTIGPLTPQTVTVVHAGLGSL